MKLVNYSFGRDNISLEIDDLYVDLHNNYDFKLIEYSIEKRTIRLFWEKNSGDWVPRNNPGKIRLEFDGVTQFRMKERDPKIPFSEDDCLSEIGFLPPNMWNDFNVSVEHKPSAEDHLLVDFMSEAAFKIEAASAKCILE